MSYLFTGIQIICEALFCLDIVLFSVPTSRRVPKPHITFTNAPLPILELRCTTSGRHCGPRYIQLLSPGFGILPRRVLSERERERPRVLLRRHHAVELALRLRERRGDHLVLLLVDNFLRPALEDVRQETWPTGCLCSRALSDSIPKRSVCENPHNPQLASTVSPRLSYQGPFI